jgi:CRP-like cAMP-binding protein
VTGVVPPNSGAAAAAAFEPAPGAAAEPLHFLQRIKLFSALSVDDRQQVVKRMKRRDFLPNQIIVRDGAPGNSMFFLTAGLVDVRRKDPHTGIDFLLTEMGPGQNVGEMALLTGKPRTATVTSVQPHHLRRAGAG